jgi:glycosyltransferase involved in cell wall biosynthesis
MIMKLSIIMPVYNEAATIREAIRQVQLAVLPDNLERELVVVDDCSTDDSRTILQTISDTEVKLYFKDKNEGKGSAVRLGFQRATGDIILIQDTDLEYDPAEYAKLLAPILAGRADVVFGSRFAGSEAKRVLFFWHAIGNHLLTTFSNLFTNLNLTDMETCYKVFTREVIDSFKDKLSARRFGIEPELTARVARGHWRIYEVGISYRGRTYAEGKKVNWRDGLAAFWHIIKFNLFKK